MPARDARLVPGLLGEEGPDLTFPLVPVSRLGLLETDSYQCFLDRVLAHTNDHSDSTIAHAPSGDGPG